MYGHGNWNTSCWLFDTTKEKWSKLTQYVCTKYGSHLSRLDQIFVLLILCYNLNLIIKDFLLFLRLPSVRRHFKCCIVNDKLFVVAGTGQYRVVQYNMDCYDLKKGRQDSGPKIYDHLDKVAHFPYCKEILKIMISFPGCIKKQASHIQSSFVTSGVGLGPFWR